jgi:hypothetical protein
MASAVAIRDTAAVARRWMSIRGGAFSTKGRAPKLARLSTCIEGFALMDRPPHTRRPNIDSALTLRLSHEDRDLLERLVVMRSAELSQEGYETTVAGYLRGLIRREAAARGIRTARAKGAEP